MSQQRKDGTEFQKAAGGVYYPDLPPLINGETAIVRSTYDVQDDKGKMMKMPPGWSRPGATWVHPVFGLVYRDTSRPTAPWVGGPNAQGIVAGVRDVGPFSSAGAAVKALEAVNRECGVSQ